jgi:hypothetical protein
MPVSQEFYKKLDKIPYTVYNRCTSPVKTKKIIMKPVQKIQSSLCCKATASLNVEIMSELKEKDKSLGNLLDETEKEDKNPNICGCSENKDKGCGNSI